jgi:hypothetical protein
MIPPTQREALDVLAELCDLAPDMGLGQLVAWLGDMGEDETGRSLGYIDDEQLLEVMYRHREQLVARLQPESNQTPPHGDIP